MLGERRFHYFSHLGRRACEERTLAAWPPIWRMAEGEEKRPAGAVP